MPVVVLPETTLRSPDAIIDAVNDLISLDDVLCEYFMTDTIVANGFSKEQSVAPVKLTTTAGDWIVREVLRLKAQPQTRTIADGLQHEMVFSRCELARTPLPPPVFTTLADIQHIASDSGILTNRRVMDNFG
jgi:hypothetical protein